MGLMYMFPVSKEETDRIDLVEDSNGKTIILKSYGLPLIFWGYLTAILIVIGFMFLAVNTPIQKLIATGEPINILLSYSVIFVLLALPITLISLYFYEKSIVKNGCQLSLVHKIFWVPVWRKKINLKSKKSLELNHFLDSPNVAKMKSDASLKGFENKGYYELFATNDKEEQVFVDRHSRKADMVKLRDLLNQY